MLFEIGFPQEPTIGTHKRVDPVSDLAFIESVPPFLANQSERSRQIRVLEDVAFTGSASLLIKRVGLEKRSGQSFVEAGAEQPGKNDQNRDWENILVVAKRPGRTPAPFPFDDIFFVFPPPLHPTLTH